MKYPLCTIALAVIISAIAPSHAWHHNAPYYDQQSVCPFQRAGHAGIQGKRPTMEDAHAILATGHATLYGLYDGHGGSEVSRYVADTLNEAINEYLEDSKRNADGWISVPVIYTPGCMDKALSYGYKATQEQLCEGGKEIPDAGYQGSTAVTAIVTPTHIVIANVGDSRAVLFSTQETIALTDDHKPNRPDEQKRIEDLGGSIFHHGVWRVRSFFGFGGLAVSRALGDCAYSPYVTAEPEIMVHERTPHDQFLIIACDGVWDVMSNSDATAFVKEQLMRHKKSPEQAANALAHEAFARGSMDNISAIVIDLRMP